MRILSFFSWVQKNIVFFLSSCCFVLCLSFVVREMMDHAAIFGLSETNRNIFDESDFRSVIFIVYLMAISGLVITLTLFKTIVSLNKLNQKTQRIYLDLQNQMKAVEYSCDGISILDADGNFTFMNESHARCYGYEVSDMMEKSWKILYTEERKEYFKNEIFPMLEKRGWWMGKSFGLKKNGTEFLQELSLKTLEDGGLVCIVRDIEKQESSEKSYEFARLAVDEAGDGIAIVSPDNKILFMNKGYMKIHEINPFGSDKYLNTDWRLFYSEEKQAEINGAALPGARLRGMWSGSLKIERRNGTFLYADLSLTKLQDSNIIIVFHDVTERFFAEVEQEKLKEQIFQSQKIQAIGRLTDGIAKDFEKILETINTFAEQIQSDESLQLNQRKSANKILKASSEAQGLVEQLQTFSRKKEIKPEIVNLKEVLREVKKVLDVSLPEDVSCTLEIKVNSALIKAASGQISQVLVNVCTNAEEALEGKGGVLLIELSDFDKDVFELRRYMLVETIPEKSALSATRMKKIGGRHFLMAGYLFQNKNYIQVTVSDNGTGITPEILANVFDPFFTTKTLDKGMGLGLSTVHGIMTGGNGAVVLETVPNEGTSVHLFFPKAEKLEKEGLKEILFDKAV